MWGSYSHGNAECCRLRCEPFCPVEVHQSSFSFQPASYLLLAGVTLRPWRRRQFIFSLHCITSQKVILGIGTFFFVGSATDTSTALQHSDALFEAICPKSNCQNLSVTMPTRLLNRSHCLRSFVSTLCFSRFYRSPLKIITPLMFYAIQCKIR
jgi:hypothetical protein